MGSGAGSSGPAGMRGSEISRNGGSRQARNVVGSLLGNFGRYDRCISNGANVRGITGSGGGAGPRPYIRRRYGRCGSNRGGNSAGGRTVSRARPKGPFDGFSCSGQSFLSYHPSVEIGVSGLDAIDQQVVLRMLILKGRKTIFSAPYGEPWQNDFGDFRNKPHICSGKFVVSM